MDVIFPKLAADLLLVMMKPALPWQPFSSVLTQASYPSSTVSPAEKAPGQITKLF
jgi:hypothetical protein